MGAKRHSTSSSTTSSNTSGVSDSPQTESGPDRNDSDGQFGWDFQVNAGIAYARSLHVPILPYIIIVQFAAAGISAGKVRACAGSHVGSAVGIEGVEVFAPGDSHGLSV